jgi:hypothetical protein
LNSSVTVLRRNLTRFRRASSGEVIHGPKQGFSFVPSGGGYFSADLKSFLSHSLNMHFPITRSSIAFLKKKVIILSLSYRLAEKNWSRSTVKERGELPTKSHLYMALKRAKASQNLV